MFTINVILMTIYTLSTSDLVRVQKCLQVSRVISISWHWSRRTFMSDGTFRVIELGNVLCCLYAFQEW